MFNKNNVCTLLLTLMSLFYVSSCSQSEKKTDANFKLKLSKIVNFSTGFGSGGAIITGKSNLGHSFLKVITTQELNIELANASWTITALMWDTSSGMTPLNGDVVCGVSNANFTGGDVTINLTLNNANCNQPIFSDGRVSMVNGKNRFAKNYLEECDEVNPSIGYKCGFGNQGSALSYRAVVRGYNQLPNGASTPEAAAISSACYKVNMDKADLLNINEQGLPINYPSSSGTYKFPIEIEFFYTDDACSEGLKGKYVLNLKQGLIAETSPAHKILTSNESCTYTSGDFTKIIPYDSQVFCDSVYGSWSGSSCTGPSYVTEMLKSFAPVSECSGSRITIGTSLKHLIAIPKSFTCDRYMDRSVVIGPHPFASGNGTLIRPYKICTEWQLNQIGELGAPSSYLSSHFKLLNDLDMNKTFWGPYSKPTCVGIAGSLVRHHDSFNPLDQMYNGDCGVVSASNSFTGVFDGSGKKISFMRTQAESVDYVGFVRKLNGGLIRDLKFYKSEFSGRSYVGAVAGFVEDNAFPKILNIDINDIDLRVQYNGSGGNFIGGAVGSANSSNFFASDIRIKNAEIEGDDYVGGIIGKNFGTLNRSSFKGHIDTHNYSGTKFGGLVGDNVSGAYIKNSFSEGFINSGGSNTGGVAGSTINAPEFTYSTMVIVNYNNSSGTNTGGIVGSGPVGINSYFDGTVSYQGGGSTPSIHKLSSSFSTQNFIYRDPGAATTVTTETYATLRTDLSSNIHPSDASFWSFTPGSLPRFSWENRECSALANQSSVSNQVTLGRGTLMNPIILCNADQFYSMTSATSYYYRMAEDINLASMTNATMLSNFYGQLDGEGNILYGLQLSLTGSTPEANGIIRINHGGLKNLRLYGNNLQNIDTSDLSNGILVGENNGSISKIEMDYNGNMSHNRVGFVAGLNAGGATISDVSVLDGKIVGVSNVGGIVGENNGSLSRVSYGGVVNRYTANTNFFNLGGITGLNHGSIDQALMQGKIYIDDISVEPYVNIGGLVGKQSSTGVLTNSMVEDYSSITVKNTNNVGGLIGFNDGGGLIQKSFTLGRVIYSNSGANAATSQPFHSFVGDQSGTSSDSYFLSNSAVTFKQSPNINTCAPDSPSVGINRLHIPSSIASLNLSNPANKADLFTTNMMMHQSGISKLTPFTLNISDYVDYYQTDYSTCLSGEMIYLYRAYALSYSDGLLQATGFSNVSNFSNYDLAYSDMATPANSTNQTRLYDYFKSEMYGTPPASTPPIWEYESGEEYPRLLQVER
jgi:hypothetical protein